MVNSGHSCAICLGILLELEECILVGDLDVTSIGLIGVLIWLKARATESHISLPTNRNGVILLCQSAFDEGLLLADLWRWFFASIMYWSKILARSPVVCNHRAIVHSNMLVLFLAVRSCRILG